MELRTHGFPAEANDFLIRILDWFHAQDECGPACDGDNLGEVRRYAVQAYSMLGRYAEAIEIAEILVDEFPLRLDFKGRLATAYARSGDTTAARRLSDEIAAADEPYLQGIPELWRARITAQLSVAAPMPFG